jgi:hypothetical protein
LFHSFPLFLEPCGFHIRAASQGSRSFFRNVRRVYFELNKNLKQD